MSRDSDDSVDALLRAVADSPAISTTSVVGERFGLIRRLGEGTFGVVYEAEDRTQGRRVALKMLRQPRPDWIHRFKREFRTLRDLSHRNLVALDELFCIGDSWFFTMELLDGIDILNHVRTSAPPRLPPLNAQGFDATRLRRALSQLADGLAVFHSSGRAHRDIKPSNVLVNRDQRVVVLDFGLATDGSSEELSVVSAVVGTPVYMAPEQAAGRTVTPAADLYAVGVLMHEMLTGRRPARDGANDLGNVPRDLGELCLELLRPDPAERPTAAQLRTRLLEPSERISTLQPGRVDIGFVGREHELVTLSRAFDAARRGAPSVCILHGESGIGKSRTVRQFIEKLQREEAAVVVLEGQCHEREAVPYKTIDGVLDSLVRYLLSLSDGEIAPLLPTRAGSLAQVFPALLRVPSVARHAARMESEALPDVRTRAFGELRDLLTRLALAYPTVIAIDNLQWADEDGLRALAELVRPPESPPLLIIGTLRTSAHGHDRSQLDVLGNALSVQVNDLRLDVLGRADCRRLAEQLMNERRIADSDVERIAFESGGHPLFIEHLVENLGASPSDELTLDHAIWARVIGLEPTQRRLAEVIAFAGRPIDPFIAGRAAQIDGAELTPAVTALCVSRITRRGSDRRLDVYHGRIRDAMYARVERARHAGLHARLATEYEAEQHQDCEAIATHWQEAGEPTRALSFIVRAADNAARTLAFDRAAVWYQQAIAIAKDDPALRRDMQCKLGDALANAGRGALAAAQFHAAAVSSPPESAIVLHRLEADQLLRSGHLARGLEVINRIMTMVGIVVPRSRIGLIISLLKYRTVLAIRGFRCQERMPGEVPPTMLAQLEICLVAAFGLAPIDPLLALFFHRRGLLKALKLGEPDRVCRALSFELVYLGSYGRRARRRFVRLLAHAQSIAQTFTEPHAFLLGGIGWSFVLNGAFEDGLQHSDRAIELLKKRSPGLIHEIVTMERASIHALAELGRYSELQRRQREGLHDALGRGDVFAQIVFTTHSACIGWLISDRPAEAETAIASAMHAWPKQPIHFQHVWALSSRILLSLYRGDARMAQSLAGEFGIAARDSMLHRVQIIRVMIYYYRGWAALIATAHGVGDASALLKQVTRCARLLEAEKTEWIQGFVCQLRGGVLLHKGQVRAASEELERAVAAFEKWGMMGYAMATLERLVRLQEGGPADPRRARVTTFFRDQGAVSPERMIAMLAPGVHRNRA